MIRIETGSLCLKSEISDEYLCQKIFVATHDSSVSSPKSDKSSKFPQKLTKTITKRAVGTTSKTKKQRKNKVTAMGRRRPKFQRCSDITDDFSDLVALYDAPSESSQETNFGLSTERILPSGEPDYQSQVDALASF